MSNLQQLQRCKSEDQGIDSSAIHAFLKAVDESELGLHSFMLLRHGYVLEETYWPPYEPEHHHELFSVSKSFTSTAVGLAVEERLLSINDSVLSYFEKDVTPAVADNMRDLKIKHLLTMSTGPTQDPLDRLTSHKSQRWVKGFLETPIEQTPGKHFVYSSSASYMLSAIISQAAGEPLLDYLQPRLFEPLGIKGAVWGSCPEGVNYGGWGLNLTTGDLAKFGQLYLQKGNWKGNQLLSPQWIEEATRSHITTQGENGIDKQQGYGYQFYMCRFGIYCARGAHGQFSIVMPEQNAVIAITSHVTNMQAVLDLVWEHLLPQLSQ